MATIEIELKPFSVPAFVVPVKNEPHSRSDTYPSLPVSDVSRENLNDLVGDWLLSLYGAAGYVSPWRNEG